MTSIILLTSVVFILYFAQAITNAEGSKVSGNSREVLAFGMLKNIFATAFSLITLLVFLKSDGIGEVNGFTLPVSLLAGVSQAICTFLIISLLKRISLIQVNLFMTAGIIVPTVLFSIFFGEALTFLKILGILVFLISAVFILGVKKPSDLIAKKGDILPLFTLFFFYGLILFSHKAYPTLIEGGSVSLFSLLMYGSSTIIMTLIMLFTKKKDEISSEKPKPKKKFVLIAMLSAVVIFLLNQTSVPLSGMLPSAVVFPLTNGGNILMASLASFIIYKERPKLSLLIGFVLFTASMILLLV